MLHLMVVSVNVMVCSWRYNIALNLLRQELMAGIDGVYDFNGILMAINNLLMVHASSSVYNDNSNTIRLVMHNISL